MTTESVEAFNSWSKYINIVNCFNIAKVNGETIFGHIIIEGFKLDPDAAIKMMRDQIKDNPEMIKEIIGDYNFKLIL